MAFSIQKRWEIVFLHIHRLRPKLSLRSIAKEVKYSIDTVQTWIKQYQETGDVQDKGGQGRKRKTSDKEDRDIVTIAKKHKIGSSANISILINKKRINVSSATIRRQLNEQGFYKLKPLSKPLFSDLHRLNQLKWAKTHRN